MKRNLICRIACFVACALCFNVAVNAQLLKRIKKEVKNRVENKVVNGAGNTADKTVDKAGKTAKDAVKGKNSNGENKEEDVTAGTDQNTKKQPRSVGYTSYDFVPGDRIIFQPDLSGESDAELPARFIIKKGNAEIQSYEGEKVLHLNAGGYTTVSPLMDNDSYLPEQFTLEFDLMYENPRDDYFAFFNNFKVQFYTGEDQNFEGYGLAEFTIRSNTETVLGKSNSGASHVSPDVKKALNTNDTWHHIAIYVRKNIAKAYIGGTRVQATNNFPAGAAKLAIRTDGRYGMKIKNFRLAAGGDDKYNKIVTEGKFITHGILFDVNKSTIKEQSMGALNEIVKLMKAHTDLKFEINGHTDSDGNPDANLKLSEQRAIAVKNKLVDMGIGEERLTTKGNGATKPIDNNDTQEGKANNRRVEFVKI